MKIIKYLTILAFIMTGPSCKKYLDIIPDNVATLEYAFRDRVRAQNYLYTCYSYMPRIGSANDPALIGDAVWSVVRNSWTYPNKGFDIMYSGNNVTNPDLNFWDGTNSATNLWGGIRDCNVFLENIDKVRDLRGDERTRWIAEVKFLKAYYHFYLLRLYGPIPIVKENLPISASPKHVAVYREPVDKVFDYIVELLDEAAPDLPLKIENQVSEAGRISRAIALSVKAKVLVTEASPLFNGNPDYATMVDNRNIHLFSETVDNTKWIKALDACKVAIDACHAAGIELYQFQNTSLNLSDSTKKVIQVSQIVTDKWNKETIWGWESNVRIGAAGPTGMLTSWSTERFTIGFMDPNWRVDLLACWTPTMKMAEMFYSDHGVPIDEDRTYDYANRYSLAVVPEEEKYFMQPGYTTAKLHLNREARFYGNIGVDGGWWFGIGKFSDEAQWPIQSRKGQVAGEGAAGRFSETSFYIKKLHNYQSVFSGTSLIEKRWNWPIFRLSDLYLLYAEALNETLDAPNSEVYKYLDMIRARAGLKGIAESWRDYSIYPQKYLTKDGMRTIIHRERNIELAFERHRYYDMRRWKEALQNFDGPGRGWNIKGETPEDFYRVVTLHYIPYHLRDIFWPISQKQILINKNLVQNPGW